MIALLNRAAFNFRLWTLLLPVVSFVLTGTIWLQFASGAEINPLPYFGLLVFTTVAWAIAVENYGLYTAKFILTSGGKIYTTCLATLFTVFAELLFIFFYQSTSFSRVFICAHAAVLLLSAISLRFLLRAATRNRMLPGMPKIRVLMVGADEFAMSTAKALVNREFKGVEIAGFVRLPGQETEVGGAVCDLDGVGDMLQGNRFDDVVIALSASRLHELSKFVAVVRQFGVPVRAVLDLGDQNPASERLFSINGIWMVNLCHTPAESIMYMVSKRTFDIAFSSLVLVAFTPLMTLIAAAIKITSPGPLFFTQDRVGFSGDVFKMYKFRTMRVSSKAESDTRWTCADDDRRTVVGTFLRKTSLDELPQFINVLKGEMSVVGPRPERPYFVQKFAAQMPGYNSRHHLKVGITGWAQVNGWRGDSSIEKRIELDLFYLHNWSLMFDLRIVLLTVLRSFYAKHAY
jgi:Undecaprenyl-phosphate glucose phosphotransferase